MTGSWICAYARMAKITNGHDEEKIVFEIATGP
jgi:hypothetical protein